MQPVREPVTPKVLVRVVVPVKAVVVLTVQSRILPFAGSAKTVTDWVICAALATVLVVPSGLVMRKLEPELATVHLATCGAAPNGPSPTPAPISSLPTLMAQR